MEKKLGFQKENDYQIYKDSGRPVRIGVNNDSHIGWIFNAREDFLELLPSVIHENFPLENNTMKYSARMENDLPKKINYNIIQNVDPLSKDYPERLIKSINNIKTISPQQEKGENQKWQKII